MAKTQRSIGKNEERWLSNYQNLTQYAQTHGHCLVPQTYPPNPTLGRWVQKQRAEYSLLQKGETSRMTPKRMELLNQIGFVWDKHEATWSAKLEELREYKGVHGHVNVKQSEGALGVWVRNQRMQYSYLQSGKKYVGDFFTKERQKLLEELGFCWNVNDANWMEKFESLKKFKRNFGHVNVPSQYEEDRALARWVLQVRNQYKKYHETNDMEEEKEERTATTTGKQNKLTKERIKLLDSIGFVWDPNDAKWWENYESLVTYREEFGHCAVPQKYKENRKLGAWVSKQQKLCRDYVAAVEDGTILDFGDVMNIIQGLNEERIKALRNVDFCYLPLPGEMKREELKLKLIVPNVIRTPKPKPKPPVIPFPWDEI